MNRNELASLRRSSVAALAPQSRAGRVAAFYAALTASAVLWGALRGHPNVLLFDAEPTLSASLHASHRAAQLVSSAAIGVAVGLLLVVLTRILHARYDWARVLHSEFNDVLGPLSDREILLFAAASAIGEEFLFRGALLLHLKALAPGIAGLALAIFGSAAIFALLHIGPGARFLPWTLSSFVVGLLLAVVYVALGDLIAPIAIHFTVNALNLKDIVRRQLPA
ncbi:MAG: CPBP family intramembrane metalloprotease [Myxococcales bacterium]|nr:CPBP family intramembrane metalloprotease [Myxococcales bacterium]